MTLTLNADSIRPVADLFRRLKVRTTLPILGHFRITLPPDRTEATIETTDLDVHISVTVPVSGPATAGSFTIPRDEFFILAKSDKGTAVLFTTEKHSVQITHTAKGLRSRRKFNSLDPDDFPEAPVMDAAPVIIPSEMLEAVRRVRPCVSTDETRYVITGVLLCPFAGGDVVATNGMWLAHVPTRVPCPETIVPVATADLLFDPAFSGPAVGRFASDKFSLASGGTTVWSKAIEGKFPNYRQVIPTERNGYCTFPEKVVPGLIAWLGNFRDKTVIFNFKTNALTLTVNERDAENVTTTVPVLTRDKVPCIAFNAKQIRDALAMGLHTVDLIDELSPGIFTDGITRLVVMPKRCIPEVVAQKEPAAEPTEA